MIESKDIKTLCAYVRHFSQKAGWLWKGLPIIVWEFATMDQFMDAYAHLMQAITADIAPYNEKAMRRLVASEIVELDCHGVTFRLICKEKRMMPRGPVGVADLIG